MSERINAHLLELLLDVSVPVILDLIVCSSREVRGYFRPSVAKLRMEVNDHFLFILGQKASLQVWPQVIGPPQPATLSTPQQSCKLGNSPPTALAMGEDEVDELLVLFSCPWPFLQSNFVTARLSSHSSALPLPFSL